MRERDCHEHGQVLLLAGPGPSTGEELRGGEARWCVHNGGRRPLGKLVRTSEALGEVMGIWVPAALSPGGRYL